MEGEIWWSLPGPRRFMRRIAEDVEEGRSVIVALPEPLGDGRWARRLQDARIVRARDSLPVPDIRTCPAPMQVVARHLLPSELDLYGATVASMCDAAARAFESAAAQGGHFGTTLAVLECPAEWPAWSHWASFLSEWAQASRNKPLAARIVFIAIVAGRTPAELPGEQDSLRVRRWDSVCDEADILTYAHLAFAEWPAPALHRRIGAAVAAALAIWDPDVVDALAGSRLEDVLRPMPSLRQLAQGRGWTRAELGRGSSWEKGQEGSVGGAPRLHSAALALLGDAATIDSRVWAGQVGVLLPFVEERRLEIIQELKSLLRVPWRTAFGIITDIRDLEIAHLCDQIEAYRLPLGPELHGALPVLRQLRNKLAHVEVVDSAMLGDERLVRVQHGATALGRVSAPRADSAPGVHAGSAMLAPDLTDAVIRR